MNKNTQLGIAALLFGIAATLYLLNQNTTIANICIGTGCFLTARALFPMRKK